MYKLVRVKALKDINKNIESRITSGITDDVMHERDDEQLDIEYCHNGRRNGRIE